MHAQQKIRNKGDASDRMSLIHKILEILCAENLLSKRKKNEVLHTRSQ